MPVRLGRFEMPKRLTKEDATASDTYARFIAEPFETGYGHTVGNSLRRVLLSSLEGAAIASIKIDPQALNPGDAQLLEDMILTAANQALGQAKEISNAEMGKATAGFNLPGLT